MKVIGFCTLIILLVGSSDGYFNQAKVYHLMTSTPTNWFKAFAYCRNRNMILASISSEKENDQILQLIQREGHCDKHFWTSGTKLGNNEVYYWMGTGKSLQYTNWSPNQPDNHDWHTDEPEACIEFLTNEWGNKWNDARCGAENYHFICEEIVI